MLAADAVLAEDMGKDLVRVRVFAGGRVQGVAYRFYAEKCAVRLGVTGWVRNLSDGRVEVLAEGSAEHVETLLDRLREGPSLARVESFDVRREQATGEFSDFRVVYHPD
jgi:acylphosphatase